MCRGTPAARRLSKRLSTTSPVPRRRSAAGATRRLDPAIPVSTDLNRRPLQLERSFIEDGGLPGREWYKHVLMAPARSYQPLVLPGLAEALDSADAGRFASQAERLAAALRRAAVLLAER